MYKQHFEHVSKIMDKALEHSSLDGVLVFSGNAKNYFLDDMPYAFQSNPHFRWVVPVPTTPYCILHYQAGKRPTLYLFQPVDYWHSSPEVPHGEWVNYFEIKPISKKEDLPDFSTLNRHAWVGQEGSNDYSNLVQNPQVYMDYIHYHRAVKTDYELENIKEANRIALKGHKAAEKAFFEGKSEFETHVDYLLATQSGEHELPYGNIIAQNQNAAILHYHHLSRARHKNQNLKSFLIDAGASFNGYASDITRTYSYTEGDFKNLIKRVDEEQIKICNNAVAGADYVDLHVGYHKTLADILVEYEITNGSANQALDSGLTSVFFPHGLGHFIGLQVHDIGGHQGDENGVINRPPENHPFLRLTRKLETNHVLTIEPGLYFIDILLNEAKKDKKLNQQINWERVEEFRPFGGIRIEDNVIVKPSTAINLTRELEST